MEGGKLRKWMIRFFLFFCCWLIAISISGGVSLVHYYAKPTFPRMARMERASSEQGHLGKH